MRRYLQRRRDKKGPAFTYEVLIVDDGSTDATVRVAMQYVRKCGNPASCCHLSSCRAHHMHSESVCRQQKCRHGSGQEAQAGWPVRERIRAPAHACKLCVAKAMIERAWL